MPEHYLQICHHITALTGGHSALLHILSQSFLKQPFQYGCALEPNHCTASRVHLFSAYEAQRWGGKYIYYCPKGFLFLSVIPYTMDVVAEYSIIVGPIIMENSNGDFCEGTFDEFDSSKKIPCMTTSQVHSLCELVLAAASVQLSPHKVSCLDTDSSALARIVKDYASSSQAADFLTENERQLQEYIRIGDKEAAQKMLNKHLIYLYANTGNDLMQMKIHIREMLVWMNKAAIDGNADIDEIFNLCCRCERELGSIQTIDDMDRWFGMVLHQYIGFVFDFGVIKHQNIILQITNYIKDHLSERISLDQAAAQVYLSKSYFCRIIKNELGCTFTEYVNRLRVERSKVLLCRLEFSIAEISTAVGFEDQSYFTRIFKRTTGISPKKYRNQCYQENYANCKKAIYNKRTDA